MSTAAQKRRIRKAGLVERLEEYLTSYRNVLIIQVDNVGSNQMQKVRLALRGKGAMLLGKNTLVRKVVREQAAKNTKLEALVPFVRGNMGFVFTNENLAEVRKLIQDLKAPAPARVGTFAPNDVQIPAGSTGLDPGQTSFFQALNIATKIVKGAIEIVNEVTLIKTGVKVTSSHVALLDKLGIKPFKYGIIVSDVYEDGNTYSASILDMSESDLLDKFSNGVNTIAAISLAIGIPTAASLKHNVFGAFSKLLYLSLATEYTFPQAQKFKDILANPGAFAATTVSSSSATTTAAAPVEKEEEEETDMGFSLFD
jgi:large subunit ribosomal protein LP0